MEFKLVEVLTQENKKILSFADNEKDIRRVLKLEILPYDTVSDKFEVGKTYLFSFIDKNKLDQFVENE